jgi:hypothetical protein
MTDMDGETPRSSAMASVEHARAANELDALAEAVESGPRGALLVAGIAAALLLAGWLAFYFLLFLPRGAVG